MDADMPKGRKKEKERFHYDMVNNHIHEYIISIMLLKHSDTKIR